MPEEPATAGGGARWMLALALALASLLLLSDLGATLWGSEARWLIVARGMARTADPFSMTLGGETYDDKPFGSYWLVVLAAKLLGGFSEAAGRLPGVLCYLASLPVTYVLGRRTLGAHAGALAALLLATSARLLFLADTASADPQQLLGLTVAMLLLLEASESGRLRHFVWLGVVTGLTTQMKGLPGLALPAFAALLWTACVRGWSRVSVRGVLLAVLLSLLVAGAPFVAARLVVGDWKALELLWRESVVRAIHPFDHVEPWWFYLADQVELLMAWSLLLPAALLLAWSRLVAPAGVEGGGWARLASSERARRSAYPLFGYVAVLLFFSLSDSRRSYYLLPIAPFAALLVADLLLATTGGAAAVARRAGLAALGAIGMLAGLLALAVGTLRLLWDTLPAEIGEWQPVVAQVWPAIPPWLVVAGAAIVPAAMLLRAAPAARTLAATVAVLAQTALLAMVTIHVRGATDPLPRFVAAVRSIVPADQLAGLGDAHSARLRYYLDPPCGPAPAASRFRIVSTHRPSSDLAADPSWAPVRDPLLDAVTWPPGANESFALLERRPCP